jgi:hypothetical protein
MDCYEGATMIKTYRGILADDGQDRIRLKTNKGDIGYRIKKFEIMPANPGAQDSVNVVKVWKLTQSAQTSTVDFTDGDMLAAGVCQNTSSYAYGEYTTIIFDSEIFNQDIYIGNKDYASGESINYYLELEQIKLNENESTMATLQSLRRLGLPRN